MDRDVNRISLDSREQGASGLFVAIRGSQVDGHRFVDSAIENGASVILVEKLPEQLREKITYLRVDDSAEALGIAASNFYQNPSQNIRLIGVTGTNGKTTVATLLFRLFTELGYVCGLVSTVENRIGDRIVPATHTTPDAVRLNALLAEMSEAGCQYVFMEVSSHAAHQRRIAGLQFAGALFTNLTHDHLDYHGDFKSYRDAKKLFFDSLHSEAFALVNGDDRNGRFMLQNCDARHRVYSIKGPADYRSKVLENDFGGLLMNLDGTEVHSLLIGEFNAYNLLTAYGAAIELEQNQQEVLRVLSQLKPAEGRFDYLRSDRDGLVAIVDYAHTPDALEKVLATIRQIRRGDERVITVVGCGGDRDRAKRPLMAKVAAELSDQVILTSDNPRTEEPVSIIQEMEEGVPVSRRAQTLSIADRREAIRTACTIAQRSDIILVAGKGHEKYQEIDGVKHPFDDKAVLLETLQSLRR